MLSPRKKKLVIFGYLLLTVSVILATMVLVGLAQGRYFDFKTRSFSERGLILLDSKPKDATVFINGKIAKEGTPTQLLLPKGSYEIILARDGYRDWQKTLTVKDSEVTSAEYPLFLPETIVTTQLSVTNNIAAVSQSPDQKYLAFATTENRPQVLVLKTPSNEELKSVFRLPAGLKNSKILHIAWSPESEYLLLTVKTNKATVYYVVNAFNGTSHDLSSIYKNPLAKLNFGTNWNELYTLNKGDLRQLDLARSTTSEVLLKNVQSYFSSPEGLVAVQTGSGDTFNLVRLARNGSTETISRLAKGKYELMSQQYEDGFYVSARDHNSGVTTIYKINGDKSLVKTFKTFKAASLSRSPEGRFVLLQNQNQFVSYDLETRKSYNFSLNSGQVTNLTWFDEYHLLGQTDGATIMFEFDGGNKEQIGSSNNLFPAFTDKSHKFIYSVGQSIVGQKPILQLSSLARE